MDLKNNDLRCKRLLQRKKNKKPKKQNKNKQNSLYNLN